MDGRHFESCGWADQYLQHRLAQLTTFQRKWYEMFQVQILFKTTRRCEGQRQYETKDKMITQTPSHCLHSKYFDRFLSPLLLLVVHCLGLACRTSSSISERHGDRTRLRFSSKINEQTVAAIQPRIVPFLDGLLTNFHLEIIKNYEVITT